jgi:hypothetical protein
VYTTIRLTAEERADFERIAAAQGSTGIEGGIRDARHADHGNDGRSIRDAINARRSQ